jgi:hypothetical protein
LLESDKVLTVIYEANVLNGILESHFIREVLLGEIQRLVQVTGRYLMPSNWVAYQLVSGTDFWKRPPQWPGHLS